jgi:hypothetical protein
VSILYCGTLCTVAYDALSLNVERFLQDSAFHFQWMFTLVPSNVLLSAPVCIFSLAGELLSAHNRHEPSHSVSSWICECQQGTVQSSKSNDATFQPEHLLLFCVRHLANLHTTYRHDAGYHFNLIHSHLFLYLSYY